MQYSYDLDLFSDLHKDAYGVRPSQWFWEWQKSASADELQEKWDQLLADAKSAADADEAREARCLVELHATLDKMMMENNIDLETAIRWLDDANDTGGDWQYLDFNLGVKYGTIEKMLGIETHW